MVGRQGSQGRLGSLFIFFIPVNEISNNVTIFSAFILFHLISLLLLFF